ncbi:MAG: flagellar basal body rod protein FlgC [Alphaproteobacteria bacterium]|nr:flagellar basal body rod protein FlgC [Alphaproteobacteria bacterium]
MDMAKAMMIAASGMRAQNERMRVIAENLANVNSTATKPGEDPYRRQIPVFENMLDQSEGVRLVNMTGTKADSSEFREQLMPGHPAADERGYVKMPNVNALVEMMDMREAQRSFDANVNVVDAARSMMSRTIDLLRR